MVLKLRASVMVGSHGAVMSIDRLSKKLSRAAGRSGWSWHVFCASTRLTITAQYRLNTCRPALGMIARHHDRARRNAAVGDGARLRGRKFWCTLADVDAHRDDRVFLDDDAFNHFGGARR